MSYGHCPTCGAPGVERERRPNGNDRCERGHSYPSAQAAQAVHDAKALRKTLYRASLAYFGPDWDHSPEAAVCRKDALETLKRLVADDLNDRDKLLAAARAIYKP